MPFDPTIPASRFRVRPGGGVYHLSCRIAPPFADEIEIGEYRDIQELGRIARLTASCLGNVESPNLYDNEAVTSFRYKLFAACEKARAADIRLAELTSQSLH